MYLYCEPFDTCILTRKEGIAVESFPPVFSDFNSLLGLLLVLYRVTLFICMRDQISYKAFMKCKHYIEEIFSVRDSAFGHLVREVAYDLLVRLNHWPDLNDRDFVIEWHIHTFDFIKAKECLVICQNCLQEIFV